MDVQTPEPPGRLSLRLDVYSPSQVLQIVGRLCHLVLAFLIAGEVTNNRAPSLRGHCSASSLLQTHPPPSRRRSISRLSRLYDLPCSSDFSPGEEGFSSCLACPCHRAVAFTPPRSRCRIGQISAPHAAFALRLRARLPGCFVFGATSPFPSFRPGDSRSPQGRPCRWASESRFPSTLPSKLRGV